MVCSYKWNGNRFSWDWLCRLWFSRMCCHAVWQHLTSVLRNLLPLSSGSHREEACSSETLQMSYRPHSIISQTAAMNTELTNTKQNFKKWKESKSLCQDVYWG